MPKKLTRRRSSPAQLEKESAKLFSSLGLGDHPEEQQSVLGHLRSIFRGVAPVNFRSSIQRGRLCDAIADRLDEMPTLVRGMEPDQAVGLLYKLVLLLRDTWGVKDVEWPDSDQDLANHKRDSKSKSGALGKAAKKIQQWIRQKTQHEEYASSQVSERGAQYEAERSGHEEAQEAAQEPAAPAAEEPEEEPATKPAEEPEEERAATAAEGPEEELATKPAEEAQEEPATEPAEEPEEELATKPAEEPKMEPVTEPAEEHEEEPATKPAEEADPIDKPTGNSAEEREQQAPRRYRNRYVGLGEMMRLARKRARAGPLVEPESTGTTTSKKRKWACVEGGVEDDEPRRKV